MSPHRLSLVVAVLVKRLAAADGIVSVSQLELGEVERVGEMMVYGFDEDGSLLLSVKPSELSPQPDV